MRDMTKGAPLGHLFLYALPLLRCWPRGWLPGTPLPVPSLVRYAGV